MTLDASATTDPEDNIVLFAWRRSSRTGADVGGDPVTHVSQPLGVTQPYVLTVVDALGQASEDATAVTVVDTTPPAIASVTASPAHLWPPNHEMVPVTVTTTAADGCGATTCAIASVTSNEPLNGTGDGNTSVRLADHRAEHGRRAGGTIGRWQRPGLHAHGALHRSRRQRVDGDDDRLRCALRRPALVERRDWHRTRD